MNDAKYYRHALAIMWNLFSERRTDVAEFCDMALDQKPIEDLFNFKPEHRFIQAGNGNVLVEYDTLTTLLHISFDEGLTWTEMPNHQYK
jgi:hypothetical protein